MAEQQLVDYITKAKSAGQSDDQTKNLLLKNGWTEAEIVDAFSALAPAQPQVQAQPQAQAAAQVVTTEKLEPETQIKIQTKPQQQPATAVSKAESDMPRIRNSHLFMKLTMVLIIIVVLGGAAYFVAGQYINIPWNPFKANPEKVISKMMTNMQAIKSSHASVNGSIVATDNKKNNLGNIVLTMNGDSDTTIPANPKAVTAFTLKATMPGSTTPILSADLNLVVIGSAIYFKIDNVTIPNGYSNSGLDVSQINGKWFKFDQDSIKALSQVQAEVSQVNGLEVAQKIKDLVAAENMFTFKKELASEVIDGQSTYHYLTVITKDKIKSLLSKIIALEMQEVAKAQGQNNTTDASGTALAQNIIQAVVGTVTDAIGDINVEMWIGKKDSLLYKTKFDKAIDLSKLNAAVSGIEIKFETTNSNFNKAIAVKAPEGSQKIEEILLPLLKVQKIKNDMRQISSFGPFVFAKDRAYSSLCSMGLLNGYLNTYGETLVTINNDIVAQGAQKPVCFAGFQGYCISTKLADGKYICVDELGIPGTTRCISSATVCK